MVRRSFRALFLLVAILAVASGPVPAGEGGERPEPFSLDRAVPPWNVSRPSIHGYLEAFASEKDGLSEEQLILPDDKVYAEAHTGGIRWAPGALDGLLSHHSASLVEEERVEELYAVLRAFLDNPGDAGLAALYESILAETTVLGVVDGLKDRIYADQPENADLLHDLAYWLATRSPDRNAVKLGIALLGLFVTRHNSEMMVFGAHDEFTLYALVALATTNPPERAEDLFDALARRVHGWGRIFAVERLSGTDRRDIRNWLVREGYKNSIMTEYIAYECAVGGGLLADLRARRVYGAPRAGGEDLIIGAGEILAALIRGGPAEGMAQYEDGVEAVEYFLPCLEAAGTGDPRFFLYASEIGDFAADPDQDWESLEKVGWTREKRAAVLERAEAVTQRPEWRETLVSCLEDADGGGFSSSAAAADRFGLDTWPYRFARQRGMEADVWDDSWLKLMDTGDAERLAAVLELAGEKLDLEALAGRGEGEDSPLLTALDAVLYGLTAHPGEGWRSVEAALRSPVLRYRSTAVRCLTEWGRLNWPAGAEGELRRALAAETDGETVKEMRALLEP